MKFRRGDTGEIKIRPTVGIGCLHFEGNVFDCKILLSMVSYGEKECKANVGVTNEVDDQRFCFKEIEAKDWNTTHSIIIQAREEEHHDYSATYKVELRVEEHGQHPIWGNYRLQDITVLLHIVLYTHCYSLTSNHACFSYFHDLVIRFQIRINF